MAIITVELDPNEPLTEEQIKELEALKDRPIIFEKVAEARILLKEYRGFSAIAAYEPESKVFFGRLDGIRDLVTFEAESESELVTQFQEAVDDYIDLCATLREASLSMFTEDYMQPEDGDTDKETTLFDDLMQGLNEAIAYERGEGDANFYRVETPALEIQFLEGTTFEVTFQDGYVKRYDIAQLFEKYPQLKALEDRTLFLSGKLDGYYGIRWTDELDLETETVYQEGETVRKLPPAPNIAVGEAVLSARAKKGYTQKQLSEATGIDQSDISKIERGVANPSISTLNKIAMALGMQLYVSIA